MNLGYANGWVETPEIIEKCRESRDRGEKHETWSRNDGRCLNSYGCKTCGYEYKVDSSD